MRHDEHRDVLRPVPVSVATSAVAAAASGAPSPASTSTLSAAALTLPAPAQSTVMSTSGQPPFATTTVAVATAACRDVAVLASSCFALSATAVAVSASACRDVANIAFRFVLDASSDGLSVLVWQRVPRCE